jgi:hypothetical protein
MGHSSYLALVPFELLPRHRRLCRFLLEHPPSDGARSSGNSSGFSLALFAIFSAWAIPLFWSEDHHNFTAEHSFSILVSSLWMVRAVPPLLFVNMSSATLESVAKLMSILQRLVTDLVI